MLMFILLNVVSLSIQMSSIHISIYKNLRDIYTILHNAFEVRVLRIVEKQREGCGGDEQFRKLLKKH